MYETDFLGFSYGFRPGRSQHNALDALYTGLLTRKVNWVLDADIRGFFDAIDRDGPVPAYGLNLSSLSFAEARRCHLRQGPDAVIPLVRIRGGGAPSRGIPTATS